VLPTDTHGRRILATDRRELLREGAQARGQAGHLRRRLGAVLVSAGVRLSPEAAPQHRSALDRS